VSDSKGTRVRLKLQVNPSPSPGPRPRAQAAGRGPARAAPISGWIQSPSDLSQSCFRQWRVYTSLRSPLVVKQQPRLGRPGISGMLDSRGSSLPEGPSGTTIPSRYPTWI
jgi:hypothetical protein